MSSFRQENILVVLVGLIEQDGGRCHEIMIIRTSAPGGCLLLRTPTALLVSTAMALPTATAPPPPVEWCQSSESSYKRSYIYIASFVYDDLNIHIEDISRISRSDAYNLGHHKSLIYPHIHIFLTGDIALTSHIIQQNFLSTICLLTRYILLMN